MPLKTDHVPYFPPQFRAAQPGYVPGQQAGRHPARLNEARLSDEVEADLRKIVELGFARTLRDQPHTYEVRRIIKAFVDAQWLAEFDAKLAEYQRLGAPA